jgi:hypothetical protein
VIFFLLLDGSGKHLLIALFIIIYLGFIGFRLQKACFTIDDDGDK